MNTTLVQKLKVLEDLREEFSGDLSIANVMDTVIEQYHKEENGTS